MLCGFRIVGVELGKDRLHLVEDKQSRQKDQQEDGQREIKEDSPDLRGIGRDVCEAECPGHDRNQKEIAAHIKYMRASLANDAAVVMTACDWLSSRPLIRLADS